MLSIKNYNRKKDSSILVIFSVACIVLATISHPNHINALNNNKNINTGNSNSTRFATTNIPTDNLITNILAKNLEDHLKKAGAILEITSKLPQVRNVSYTHLLNQTLKTLHGIPGNSDVDKREIAQDILSNDKDFGVIFFLMANGDVYLVEPYKRQLNLTTNNFSFRDYYKGAVNTGNTYLGNVIISASIGLPQVNIATPVFSEGNKPASNKTLTGILAGGLNLTVFNESLQALNLKDGLRIVYVDQFGRKIADSDKSSSSLLNKNSNEPFANLQSFRNAVDGRKSGSTIETINDNKMLIFYEPVKFRSTTWAVLLMQPIPPQ
jgi:hypothetical protein